VNGRLDESSEISKDSIMSMAFGHGRGFNSKPDFQEVRGLDSQEQSSYESNDECFVKPLLGLDFRMGRGAHMSKFRSYRVGGNYFHVTKARAETNPRKETEVLF
jgi:hypothetical protein